MAYTIPDSEIFSKKQPAKSEELANSITVPFFVFSWQPVEDVYTSEEIAIAPSQEVTISTQYGNAPVRNASLSIAHLSGSGVISSTVALMAHGAMFTITNTSASPATVTVTIQGEPATKQRETVSVRDKDSIRQNGLLSFVYPDSDFIQSRSQAQAIAEGLLAAHKQPRKDMTVEWIGNPAVELGDSIEVAEYKEQTATFKIYRNKTEFDGTLRQTTEARRI